MLSVLDNISEARYKIFLDFIRVKPDLIQGMVLVRFTTTAPIRTASLNFRGAVDKVDGVENWEATQSLLTLTFSKENSEHSVYVYFKSKINNESNGLFERHSSEISCIFCQGEPYGIELVFPCFNSPRIKSHWKLYLRVETFHQSFANQVTSRVVAAASDLKLGEFEGTLVQHLTNSSSEMIANNMGKFVVFKKLKQIPIHLFSVCVGNFRVYEKSIIIKTTQLDRLEPFNVRVLVSESGIMAKGPFVENIFFELTEFGVNYFVKKFGIDFPYPKVDWVFADFGFGAMENPGLITVNLFNMSLYPPGHYMQLNRIRMIVHELCHSYFGNMMSIHSWRDIWIKEAFAEFWCEKAHEKYLAQVLGNNPVEIQNLNIYRFIKFNHFIADSLTNPHSLVPSEIIEKNFYSHTVYYKGLKVLRVLADFIGRRNFKAFSRLLLDNYRNKAISTDDLFNTLDDFITAKQTQIESEIRPLLSEEDIGDLKDFCDGSSFIHPLFYKLKVFLFHENSFLILKLTHDVNSNQIIIERLSSEWHPFIIRLKIFDSNMNLKGELTGILGISQGNQIIDLSSDIPPLEKGDLVLPMMNDSGLFLCLQDEQTYRRLLLEEGILQIQDLSLRFYIYYFVKVLRKFLDEAVRETLLIAVDRFIAEENHSTFAFIKSNF
jgi:hypothetical protein